MNQIEQFLKELRESADLMYKVFTEGSCFKLYKILKAVFPEAEPYWSDMDGHCITKIGGTFYDIGGVINKEYARDNGYYLVPEESRAGYDLMKYTSDPDHQPRVYTMKYKQAKESS